MVTKINALACPREVAAQRCHFREDSLGLQPPQKPKHRDHTWTLTRKKILSRPHTGRIAHAPPNVNITNRFQDPFAHSLSTYCGQRCPGKEDTEKCWQGWSPWTLPQERGVMTSGTFYHWSTWRLNTDFIQTSTALHCCLNQWFSEWPSEGPPGASIREEKGSGRTFLSNKNSSVFYWHLLKKLGFRLKKGFLGENKMEIPYLPSFLDSVIM